MKRLTLLLLSIFCLVSCFAKGDEKKTDRCKWHFEESLGISFNSGNVNNFSVKNNGEVERNDSLVSFDMNYKFVYTKEDKEETNKGLQASVKLDFLPYDFFSPFLATEFLTNKHKGYNSKFSFLLGFKLRLYTKPSVCDYSISFAGVYDKSDYTPEKATMDKDNLRLSIRPKIKQKLGPSVNLLFCCFYQPSIRGIKEFKNDYLVSAKLGIECKLKKNFYIGFDIEDDYSSLVPSSSYSKNDISTDLSLKFKI